MSEEKPIEFYAYPASIEQMQERCDLGDSTNLSVVMYPHVKYQLEKYNMVKFIEASAYTQQQALIAELVGAFAAIMKDVKEHPYCDVNDFPLEYNNNQRAEEILTKAKEAMK